MMRSNRSVHSVLVFLTLQFFGGVIVLDAEEKLSIDIPAGEAVETLSELAVQTGLQLMYPSDLLSGVQTRDIKGRYSRQEALGLILEGTGLTSLKDKESGAYLIKRSAPKEQILTISKQKKTRRNMKKNFIFETLLIGVLAIVSPSAVFGQSEDNASETEEDLITLDPFSVVAQLDKSGYGVTSVTTITRLNTPLRDIPQTINVVTEKFMAELAAPSLGEAVAMMPNVTTRGGAPDRLQVRSIDTYSQFRNSFRITTGTVGDFEKDLTNIARVEIIKGLGSATTGRGEAGGVVNLISKKPREVRAMSIKATLDQFGYYKTEFDTTGPLTDSGNVLYRAIVSYTGGNAYTINDDYDLFSFYPSLEFRFNNNRTILSIEGALQSGETPGATLFEITDFRKNFKRDSVGVPVSNFPLPNSLVKIPTAPLRHPATLPWIDPDVQLYELTTTLSHKFNDWFSTRQAVLLLRSDVDREYTRLNGQLSGEKGWVFADDDIDKLHPIDIVYAFRWRTIENDTTFVSYQGDFLLEFGNRGGIQNQTLIGYEFTERSIFHRDRRWQDNSGFRVFDNAAYLALTRADMGPQGLRSHNDRDVSEKAVYVQHTTTLLNDRLRFMGGWRYDEIEEDITDIRNNTFTESRPEPTDKTYRFGGSFRVLPWLTVFGVHAEQTDPTKTVFRYPEGTGGVAGRDPAELVSASRTVQLDEFGIKSELFDGRITANFTYYDIKEGSNIRFFRFHTNPLDTLDPVHNWTEHVVDPDGISEGFEFEFMGAPTERITFYASASFPTNETLTAVQADGSFVTAFRRGHSDARLNLAGNYLVNNNPDMNVYLQTLLSWTDDNVLNPDNRILQSASLRWDLGLRVVRLLDRGDHGGSWEAQLRVQNVLNEKVITGTGNSHTSARRVSFSIERHF